MLALRQYQIDDVKKLAALPAAGIFNEQRTGKTPTAISVVHYLKCNKVLIVCPKSAIPIWVDEYTKWTKGRPAVAVLGTPKQREVIVHNWEKGALVIGYDSLKQTSKSKGMVEEILAKNPDVLICDEAHRFKTPSSAVYKSINKLLKIKRRYCLTGTPASGKPEEVFALLHFIDPVRFKSYWKFIDDFFYKQTIRLNTGRQFQEIRGFRTGMEAHLQKILSEVSVQRKRKEVMQWLPEKEYCDVKIPATPQQTKALKELDEFFETGDVIVQGVLDRLIRYRQICLDPKLLQLPGASPKTNWIMDYISEYPQVPTIIFSKFTSYLKLLGELLTQEDIKYNMIIGATPVQARADAVKQFQTGQLNLLLINIDAGKEALTLDRGEAIIFTDVYPPVSDIQQAEDRFVTTKQGEVDKAHIIYRLMIKGTYDEQVYNLVQHNAKLTDLVNDYKRYLQKNSV